MTTPAQIQHLMSLERHELIAQVLNLAAKVENQSKIATSLTERMSDVKWNAKVSTRKANEEAAEATRKEAKVKDVLSTIKISIDAAVVVKYPGYTIRAQAQVGYGQAEEEPVKDLPEELRLLALIVSLCESIV